MLTIFCKYNSTQIPFTYAVLHILSDAIDWGSQFFMHHSENEDLERERERGGNQKKKQKGKEANLALPSFALTSPCSTETSVTLSTSTRQNMETHCGKNIMEEVFSLLRCPYLCI